MDSPYSLTEIRLAARTIKANKNSVTELIASLTRDLTLTGPFTAHDIRESALRLGLAAMAERIILQLGRSTAVTPDPQDEIMFKGSELIAAVPRVVQAFTLKEHIHPSMLDCDGLASQLIRHMVTYREPEWRQGDIAEAGDERVYRYCGDRTWETFGTKIRYDDGKVPRPLKPLRLMDERRGS